MKKTVFIGKTYIIVIATFTFERKDKKGLKTKKKHTNTLIDTKNFNVEMRRSYEEEKKFKEYQISYETTL